ETEKPRNYTVERVFRGGLRHMRKRSQRLWFIGAAAVLVIGAIALASVALKDTVAFFYAPSDLLAKNVIQEGKSARIGGLVEMGSVTHDKGGTLLFRITD